jgi:hypothetical protein
MSTSTSRIAGGRVVLVHQVEQGRAVIQVHARLEPVLAEHGQLDAPPGGTVAAVQAFAKRILDDVGQASARPRRNLLGLGEQGVVDVDRGPHAAKHADHAA